MRSPYNGQSFLEVDNKASALDNRAWVRDGIVRLPPCGTATGIATPSEFMSTSSLTLQIRNATRDDAHRLDEVRREAFAPIFNSFRALLGVDMYDLSDAPDDEGQARYLISLLAPGSGWDVYVAETTGLVVGFVAIQLRRDSAVGEIGLNAVHPEWAGSGVGTAMYEFALGRMREAGMRVSTVATGADSSHEAARRAYEKAGFMVGIPSIRLYQTL
jgi:ribosomal protein S18 acetylase RimI-like enzyme